MSKKKVNKQQRYDMTSVSNNLLEAFVKQNNLVATKILFYIAKAEFDYPNTELVTIQIDTKPLLEYCNLDERTLKHFVRKMVETSMNIKTKERDSYIAVIPKADFMTGTDKIEVKIFREVLQLIQQVKNRFTVIDVKNLMRLNSKHSVKMIQLLELINGYDDHVAKRKHYNLEDLNNLFGTNYEKITDIERFVLAPAKEELDYNSKLSFIYQMKYIANPKGRGRPVTNEIVIDLKQNIPQGSLF